MSSAAAVPDRERGNATPLIVACAGSGIDGHGRRTVGLDNPSRLVTQLLGSRNVVLVPLHGPRMFVHPRRPEDSAATWLARVLRVIVNKVGSSEDCTEVVLEAITQLAGPGASVVRRSYAFADGDLDTGRLLVGDAEGTWRLHGLPADARVDPLIEILALALARRTRAGEFTVLRELAAAVAAGDAHDFTQVLARACGGHVRLRLAAGDTVSEHSVPGPGEMVQDIVIRSGDAISGSVEIRRATHPIDPKELTALASALLAVVGATRARDELENEVAVLNCLVDQVDILSTTKNSGPRRLVLITTAPAITDWALAGVRANLRSAAEDIPALHSLAIACAHDQRLIAVYSDLGHDVDEHRQSWERLLTKANPSHGLRALISMPIGGGEDLRQSLPSLERLSEWCAVDRTARPGRTIMADDVGPLWSSLEVWPRDRIGPYVERVLGPLVHDDRFGGELTDTLHAYLQSSGSLRTTSARLHLHSSTVKYRMRIIRDLLGDRLTDPDKRFELELALRLHLARRETRKSDVRG